MSLSGINIEIDSTQKTLGVAGGSIEVLSEQFTPNVVGYSIDNLVDLVVSAIDLMGNHIPNSTFTVSNSINNDGVNTGDFVSLSVGKNDTIDIEAVANGYQPNNISVSFVDGVHQRLTIVLTEVAKIEFVCTTTFKNSQGVTVDRPLSNGYVEVVFTGNNSFNANDYSVLFEAIPVGGSKYGSIVLNNTLTNTTIDSVTYRVDVVQQTGDYCYLSNITKRQC